MPIDFYSSLIYDFPYEQLIEIIKNKCESNEALTSYLDEWNHILRFIQRFQNKDYLRFRTKHDSYAAENKKFECFVCNQSFPEVEANYLIHFDINRIILKHKSRAKLIRTKQLIEKVNYNQDEQGHKLPHLSPIIIVPYISLKKSFLVIDGNKRLATNIKYHIPFTRYILHSPIYVKDFGFAIDWAFYWFFFDINSQFNNQILISEWFQEQIKELRFELTEY